MFLQFSTASSLARANANKGPLQMRDFILLLYSITMYFQFKITAKSECINSLLLHIALIFQFNWLLSDWRELNFCCETTLDLLSYLCI